MHPLPDPDAQHSDLQQPAAIVLCGGQSRRMGVDKASVLIGGQTMLQRVTDRVAEVARPIVVVAAPGQKLPALSDHVVVVRDDYPDQGPLGGFLTGLSVLPQILSHDNPDATQVVLTSCDCPFINPAVIAALSTSLARQPGNFDCHVVHDDVRLQPLHAVYQLRVLSTVRRIFDTGRRSLQQLLKEVRVLSTAATDLSDLDPQLLFLQNMNTLEDLEAARRLLP
ncbi:MAG: molybdenum cofactor guanylyltransferase [Fuerstiella sp.]